MSELNELKRYDFYWEGCLVNARCKSECEDGNYVLYSEAVARLAEKDAEIERLKTPTIDDARIIPWDNGGLGVRLKINGTIDMCQWVSAISSDCYFVRNIEKLAADNQRLREAISPFAYCDCNTPASVCEKKANIAQQALAATAQGEEA